MTPSNGQTTTSPGRPIRCAIYSRKSSEEGLDKEFTSLDAQRDAGEAYVASQRQEGWLCLPDRYDDGGFSGGNMERPALRRLLADIAAGKIDVVIIYKVDRLSRSLLDFARMMEVFERHGVTFVSVTQQLNTASSMGRLILNVLLSFAQFERELVSERTRDKIAATRRRGKWAGGHPLLGYDVDPDSFKLIVNDEEATRVRQIFAVYLEHGSLRRVLEELERRGWLAKCWRTRKGNARGGRLFTKSTLHGLLTNVTYLGKVRYKREVHAGEHQAIVDQTTWDEVQRLLQRDGSVRGRSGMSSDALLKGLLRCAHCGSAMIPTHCWARAKQYFYYVCSTKQKRGQQACRCRSLPASEVEQLVLRQLRSFGCRPELWAEHFGTAQEPTALAQALQGQELNRVLCLLDGPWQELAAAEQARVLRHILKRIDYDGTKFALALDAPGIQALARELARQDKEKT